MERKIIYLPESCEDPLNHSRRVYFSCCKEDFCKFDSINAQLSSVLDDFVIAYSEGEEPGGTFASELENFHLFVIPITKEWFCGGVHQEEFDIIKQQKKAVLPILYDDSLESAFNERTGNMQFLRISDGEYDEKLQRSLKDMLFDTSLLSRVESVFTHKMFVAYCREDLSQTRRLVGLLHEDEGCKQIAVWYDKYLPTGKDFRAELDKELDKCNIFGVTLTPALLEGENYVKRIEYPFAVDNDKKIVFFELQPTDREKLKEGWMRAAEQDYVSAERSSAVASYLRKVIKQVDGNVVKMKRSDSDYLLGLAYLNGLFVEFDYSFAKRKFESAANAGNSAAAHEIATMYYRGIGVGRDMARAINFYKKESKIAIENASAAIQAVVSAADTPLYKRSKVYNDILEPVDLETHEQVNKIVNDAKNAVCDAFWAALENARLFRDEGYYDDAQKAYNALLLFLESVYKKIGVFSFAKYFYYMVKNELNLLMLRKGEANLEECRKIWEECLLEYEKDKKKNCSIVLTSARAYGFLLMQKGEFSGARAVIERALEAAEAYKQDETVLENCAMLERDMVLSLLYDKGSENNIDEVLKHLLASREIIEKMGNDNPYNPSLIVWNDLYTGEAFAAAGQKNLAYQAYMKAYFGTVDFEESLDNMANELDYPSVLLQLYMNTFERIINNEFYKKEDLMEHMQLVYDRFSQKEWNAFHKKEAEKSLAVLRNMIERFGK